MALRGFVKCLADGHNYANTLLAAGAPNPKLSTDSKALDCVSEKRGLTIGATSKDCIFPTVK
jgi:hypothetical protein